MSGTYGSNIRITLFGQSHSAACGVIIDGLAAGVRLDTEQIERFLLRRAPGNREYTSGRHETDSFELLSGTVTRGEGIYTCGAPLCAVIRNRDCRPSDYEPLADTPRPSHADFTEVMRQGKYADLRGGGYQSGRLTAPLCLAGAVCMQLPQMKNVRIISHVSAVGGIKDRRIDPMSGEPPAVGEGIPTLDPNAAAAMRAELEAAAGAGDSLGGEVEIAVYGLRPGMGEPPFDGLENRIARAVFAVPAVKGIEFGDGFALAEARGSAVNDCFRAAEGGIEPASNHNGGILGGRSDGAPLIFRCAIKPTPSIKAAQQTVRFDGSPVTLSVGGRHDVCIALRAGAALEAAAAIALADCDLF